MKKIRKNRGITLIALVITVIVLLILAGVTIGTLTGDNGILIRASESKEKTEEAQEKEGLELAVTSSQMEDVNKLEITKENLENAIKQQFGNNKDFFVLDNGDGSFLVNFNDTNRSYNVSSSGDINILEKITDTTPGELVGNGTEVEPFLIESIEDLVAFAQSINNGSNDYYNEYVKLSVDLNINSIQSYYDYKNTIYGDINNDNKIESLINELTTGEGFCLIGNINKSMEENYSFKGTFDGNNHIIKNLYINKTISNSVSEQQQIGFFAVSYGNIENLGLENVNVKIKSNNSSGVTVASIVSRNYGIVDNCYVTGNVNVAATVGNFNASGLVGQNHGTVSNSFNRANITGTANGGYIYISGISAGNKTNADIIRCYNSGNIELSGSIDDGNFALCGGIVGGQEGGILNSCYNKGNIIVKSTDQNIKVGGIVGNCNGKILNSYTYGIISTPPQILCYAIAGAYSEDNENAEISNCYFLENIVNGNNSTIVNGTSSKTSEELKSISNLLGNNFKDDSKNLNNGYPILSWQ